MATNYPGAIDSLTNPSAGDALTSPSHSAQHANANDAIEAVQAELGTDPSGSAATVKARFEVIEANDWVTSARIAADAVGSSEIAANAVGSSELADNAVDTAAIQDAAVTAAKLAVQPGNLLTANQASGTDTLAATTGFAIASGSGALASSTAQYASGARSLAFTVAGTADEQMAVTPDPYAPADFIAVTPGTVVTAQFQVRSSAAEPISPRIYWYNGTSYVSAMIGATFTSSTSAWATVTVTGAAPAGCDRMVVVIQRTSGAAGSVHYFDNFGLWKGSGGLWAMPGEPIPGQSRIAVNNAVDLSGTGSPEGVVTAAPGSTWLQTDATTDVKGWLRWIKATGTGNTGWVAGAEADTGWRIVTLLNGWKNYSGSTDAGRIRRVGATVFFHVPDLRADGATSNILYTPPSGFVLSGSYSSGAFTTNGSYSLAAWRLTSSGIEVDDRTGTWSPFSVTPWHTADAWPSSLPGSAA